MTRDQRAGSGGRAVQHEPAAEATADERAPAARSEPSEVPPVVVERDASATSRPARPPTDEVRIGDRERQAVVDRLREAVGSGHLTLEEFADRVEGAWVAAIASELAPLVADLPDGAPAASTPTAAVAPTGTAPTSPTSPTAGSTEPAPATVSPADAQPVGRGRSSVIGIMSGANTRGRWRVAPKVRAFAFWGSATVDLRDALIESAVVDIHATALMGGVTVIVPEGIPVELDGFILMGGSTNRAKLDGLVPGAPVVRVHASGMWGGVDIRTKASRAHRSALDDHLDEVRAAPDGHGGPRPHGHEHGHDLRHDSGLGVDPAPARREPPAPTRPPSPPPGGWAPDPPPVPSPPTRPDPRRRADDRSSARSRSPRARGSHRSPDVPDLPEGTLTIMFTDIVDSTAAVESMGDHRWSAVIAAHDRAVRDLAAARGGTVVKGNGDGHLVVFPSARRAVLAGLELRDRAAVPLRVGLHTGEVVRQDGDVYGRNVIAASRIAAAAEPGQVVVSALTKDLVDSGGDLAFSAARTVELKGLAQPWTIHEAGLADGADR